MASKVKLQGSAGLGGQVIVTVGTSSTTKAVTSYPGCTVTIYDAGTVNPSFLWTDSSGSVPKANPLTASSSDASWSAYVNPGRYDVKFSGTGISVPFTLGNFLVLDEGGEGFNILTYGASVLGTAAANASAITAAVTAASAVGEGIYIPVGTFTTDSVTISVPVTFAPGSSILDPAAGQTISITKSFTADLSKHFNNAVSGHGSVLFSLIKDVSPNWWGFSTSSSAATNNACLVAAETALPGNSVTGGGFIILQAGNYSITGWSPTRRNITVKGAGKFATSLIGSTSGDYTVRMTNQARYQFADMSINGGAGDKDFAFQVGPGNASGGTFSNVRFEGGTGDSGGLLIGSHDGVTTDPDISELDFLNCDVVLGDAGTGATLELHGNNTINICFFGGRISTQNSSETTAVPIELNDGVTLTLYKTNLLGIDDASNGYAIEANSGVVQMFGGHVEARGLIHTAVTDPLTDATATPHVLVGVSGGLAISPELAVYHQAARTMVLQWSRLGGDIRIGNGATMVLESVVPAGGSIIKDAGSIVYGFTGGDIQTSSIVQKQAGTAITGLKFLNSDTTNGRYTEIESQFDVSDTSNKTAIRFVRSHTGINFGSAIQFLTELDDPSQLYAERFGINKDGQGVFTRSVLTGTPATLATTTPLDIGATLLTSNVLNYTPTQDSTLNLASVPSSQDITLVITTSGVTSRTITFGTNFKTTGTLATGATSGKVFVLKFQCNGTVAAEVSRTVAM